MPDQTRNPTRRLRTRGVRAPRPPSASNAKAGERAEVTRNAEVIAQRRLSALRLRIAGASCRRIAQELDISVSTAWSDLEAELTQNATLRQAERDHLKEIELTRLDDWTWHMSAQARRGNPLAVRELIRIQERRAKLLGLDAPTRHEHTGKDGQPIVVSHSGIDPSLLTDDEIADLEALHQRLLARAAARTKKDNR